LVSFFFGFTYFFNCFFISCALYRLCFLFSSHFFFENFSLLGLEDSGTDSATSEGVRELQGETATQKAASAWRKEVMPNWQVLLKKGKLTQIVFKGVPPTVRGEVWMMMLGNRLSITPEMFGTVLICFCFFLFCFF
jgi:hypothetical protein